MEVKNDHRSKFSNLSNWKEEAWKTQLSGLAPNVWLHSSVGRASHRYREGHGFESHWSPDFFRLLLSNCLNRKLTAMTILHFHLQPQFIYELFHIYFTLCWLLLLGKFVKFNWKKIAKPHAEQLHAHNSSFFECDPRKTSLLFTITVLFLARWLAHFYHQ